MGKPELKEVNAIEATPAITPEEMKAMLQADRVARETRAAERIQTVLAEERCTMNPVMTLTGQGIQARIEIVAVD